MNHLAGGDDSLLQGLHRLAAVALRYNAADGLNSQLSRYLAGAVPADAICQHGQQRRGAAGVV